MQVVDERLKRLDGRRVAVFLVLEAEMQVLTKSTLSVLAPGLTYERGVLEVSGKTRLEVAIRIEHGARIIL